MVSSKLHLMSLLDRRQRISPRVHLGDILEITAMLRLSRLFTALFCWFHHKCCPIPCKIIRKIEKCADMEHVYVTERDVFLLLSENV